MNSNKLKVVELFAGVGGFRLGLGEKNYEVVFSNQWEPLTKEQHASKVYEKRFKTGIHSNEDIEEVPTSKIPPHDVLCGGFPCQDYSVASTLVNSKGLIGKKGVLWWSIWRILSEKGKDRPKILILENVDRLLSSPASQRGRDFAVMLKSLNDLGYVVEWRVINAGEYGFPQRRRRVFFLGYKKDSPIYKKLYGETVRDWISTEGVFAKSFNIKKLKAKEEIKEIEMHDTLVGVSRYFNKGKNKFKFENSGIMKDNKIYTIKTTPLKTPITPLREKLDKNKVPEEFYISEKDIPKWEYLKNAKKEERVTSSGFKFTFSEGAVQFPDPLNKPSRTIITTEGGNAPSRFKHVVKINGKNRRLTPTELERLNGFPTNHTKLKGVTDSKRAFFMGNALVVGIVRRLGKSIHQFHYE